MNTVPPHRSYYPALDGLRGVAILLVILHHNFDFSNYFLYGSLGVDLFFVLSGFLITDIILHSMGEPGFLKNFYIRRVLRIFPVYYLLLIVSLFILPPLLKGQVDLDYYVSNQAWMWTYLQNWLFIFKEPYGSNMLLHTWSLAVEEQFYLVWPLLILWIRRPKRLIVIAGSIFLLTIVARSVLWVLEIDGLAYSSLYTFTRIDGLCIGSLVALLRFIRSDFISKHMALIVLVMAAFNFGFYFANTSRDTHLPYLAFVGYSTLAVLFGLLVHDAVIQKSKWIQLILNTRILKFFGKISYALYVFHLPINILLLPLTLEWITASGEMSLTAARTIAAILLAIAAIILSTLSAHFFEKPFLQLKQRFKA